MTTLRNRFPKLGSARRAVLMFLSVAMLMSACAPGTDGILITSAERDDEPFLAPISDTPIEIPLPHIPVIRLPDLSHIGEFDELLQDRLGSLSLQPIDGVEVITAACESGEAVLRGDESSDVFNADQLGSTLFAPESFTFEIDEATGAASYFRQAGDVRTSITTNGDGSGTFIEEGSFHHLSIEAGRDGDGRFYADNNDTITTVEADTDGSGVYYEQHDETLTTITIGTDGSGALFAQDAAQLITVDVHADGTGDYYSSTGDRTITLQVRPDGSWELADESFALSLNVRVLADGSGQYRQRGTGVSVSLDFDADGATIYGDGPGPQVIVPSVPQFIVADRLPPVGSLASIQPPCATVLRFDSQVLFDINEHEIKPEAAEVLREVAPALIDAGRALEINGHTDANGSDEHNQALSERRAQSVADLLRSLGVDVNMTVNGFGETQPVAPNYNADGSDHEIGQRANRRVEIVIPT